MNKKIISIALVLSMLIGMLAIMPISIGASSIYYIGDASTWNDFATMSAEDRAKYDEFWMTEDIDLTGYTVSQIKNFTGIFDGKGHTISGIKMETEKEAGMFECSGGEKTIQNFVLKDSSFKGNQWVGAICCDTNTTTTINNVYIASDVFITSIYTGNGNSYTGGFVGGMGTSTSYWLKINNCVFAGIVNGAGQGNGGFVGHGNSGKNGTKKHNIEINSCLMIGTVTTDRTSSTRTSGFVGYNYDEKEKSSEFSNIIKNCIYAGTSVNNYSTFIDAGNLTVENCYATVKVNNRMWCDDYNGGDSDDNVTLITHDSLVGLNCSTTVEGFTKRDGNIMIPNGVASFNLKEESFDLRGEGTVSSPYLIGSDEDWDIFYTLSKRGSDFEGEYIELDSDIDFEGATLHPVFCEMCGSKKGFKGNFNGKGYKLSNFTIVSQEDSASLFGVLDGGAIVENLIISNATIAVKNYGAVIAGGIRNSGNTIQNIYIADDVVVTGESYIGGIVGSTYSSATELDVNNCIFAGTISATKDYVGGVIGSGRDATISYCMNTGRVSSNGTVVAGIATAEKNLTISNCINTGVISAGGSYWGDIYAGNPKENGVTINDCCYVDTLMITNTDGGGPVSDNRNKKVKFEDLLGPDASVPSGFTARSGDMMVPTKIAEFAPTVFTQKLVDGAAVRLVKDDAGLRFIAVTGKAYLDSFKGEGKTVTQGIIIAPTDYITGDFTIEALGDESKYLEIEALKYVNNPEADGYYKYTGVIVDINTFNYTRDFSAIAYIKVVDDETQEATYYYSDYNEKVNSRNVADVARAALYDTKTEQVGDYQYKVLDGVYSPYTDDERTILANFCVDGDSVELEDVTFLTYNIRNIVDGKFEYEGRQNKVVSSILSYNADIIGLQEADKHSGEDWFNYLDDPTNGLLSAGYDCYKGQDIKLNDASDDVYNPIYYKANKFRVITELSGTYWYTEDGSYGKTQVGNLTAEHYKAFNYVVFEDIYTGARFVYINSHMEIRGSNNYLNPVQEQQAKYLDAFVDSLQTKDAYIGLPIVIGGDFNFDYNGMMGYFGDDSIIRNAAKEAKANGGKHVYGCSTISEDFTTVETSGSPIDHWYVCGDADVSGYEVLDNKTDGKYPSDHKPVRLTVTLIAKIKA